MARSVKKGPFVDAHLVRKIETAQATKDKRPIKTWSPLNHIAGFHRAYGCGA